MQRNERMRIYELGHLVEGVVLRAQIPNPKQSQNPKGKIQNRRARDEARALGQNSRAVCRARNPSGLVGGAPLEGFSIRAAEPVPTLWFWVWGFGICLGFGVWNFGGFGSLQGVQAERDG